MPFVPWPHINAVATSTQSTRTSIPTAQSRRTASSVAGPSTTPAAWSPSVTTRTTVHHQRRWSSPPRSPLWRSPCTWPSPDTAARRICSPPSATPRSQSSPPPDSQRDPRTVTDPDGSRYIAAFTHPDHTPGTWRQWHRTTGRELAAAGLPVRLNPGHHISLTVPAEALRV
ncbi:SseB family protein [Streptomyces canus]|uniref:SseB family protein n=1 Tax=Streptomyces canus TaxID=58343 RepID=UPI00324B015A